MKQLLLLAFTLSFFTSAIAQKRPLTHADYDQWKSIDKPKMTANGQRMIWEENPQDGDGRLLIYSFLDNQADTVARGSNALITYDDAFAVFGIEPPKDSVQAAKKAKKKKEDLPQKSLGIYDLNRGELSVIPEVISYQIPEKQAGWVAYQFAPKNPVKDSTAKATSAKAKKESEKNGSALTLQQLTNQTKMAFPFVKEYAFPKNGGRLAYVTTGNDSTVVAGVYVVDLASGKGENVMSGKGKYSKLSFSTDGDQLAFFADTDTTEKNLRPNPKLMLWRNNRLTEVADSTNNPVGKGWLVSDEFMPKFAKDGSKLYFGTMPRPLVKDTTVLEEDIVSVDVWNWQDKQLMTEQLAHLSDEKKRSYLAVFFSKTGNFRQLATPEIPLTDLVDNGNADYVVAGSNLPYSNEHWDWNGTGDIYRISLADGHATKIATAQKTGGRGADASPKGKYIYWYSKADTAWKAYDVADKKMIHLTTNARFSDEEEDDHPDYPNAYGLAGWSTDDDDILIYDRYDIWQIDPKRPAEARKLTNGREQKTRYRYVKLNEKERNISLKSPMLLHFFDETTKQSGYAELSVKSGEMRELLRGDADYPSRVFKGKRSDRLAFTRETFQEFPDLYTSDNLNFSNVRRISNANPQQVDFNWGTVEMVSWTALDGTPLKGLLYKPENFDSTKLYPMITYYYEKNSDNFHQYHVPQPVRASVNYPYYASNGYVIFVPDIVYKDGYPGQSAYNCVMPGVLSLLNTGFIDKNKLGLQGHSWGGYQTAYLITQTNLFAAAEAGAPVANMTSAYGGIRWDSGLSRMAQYEQTQSRIGGTLWDKPLEYLENSPLFYLPRVETPLLMMHNDNDGAVPWYQGIELFMGLKRLNKPVWLVNYNGEKHGLTKRKNKKDWTIRMAQFFDYYLKDAPMPVWMKSGVPAVNKTLDYGLGNGD